MMDKIGAISHVLSRIDSEFNRIADDYASVLNSIADYIDSVKYLSRAINIEFTERRNEIIFKDFDICVKLSTKLKLVGIDTNPSYCLEIDFFIEQSRVVRESVFKCYATSDGYLVEDFAKENPICQTSNEYKGKRIFELLLLNLVDKKIISI
ncbi:hypothetical protein ACYATZ_21945 [Klebsiella pneumoniae]|uniref:hypothetical protein n=1 Tax=Klebsiella pneumoniae TaxID=573 RepID=UPI001033C358|nr:hypothetical protein [Klebsiella pneumoniae]MBZ1762575.1 hypothetical protein [Klebsiella pneumoniae]QGV94577.1 hypothetical protein F7P06_19415 [Klebsiella pneumoniae]